MFLVLGQTVAGTQAGKDFAGRTFRAGLDKLLPVAVDKEGPKAGEGEFL
jgi:hypothetical protein